MQTGVQGMEYHDQAKRQGKNPRHRNILKMRIKENWDHKYPSEDDIIHAKWLGKLRELLNILYE